MHTPELNDEFRLVRAAPIAHLEEFWREAPDVLRASKAVFAKLPPP